MPCPAAVPAIHRVYHGLPFHYYDLPLLEKEKNLHKKKKTKNKQEYIIATKYEKEERYLSMRLDTSKTTRS